MAFGTKAVSISEHFPSASDNITPTNLTSLRAFVKFLLADMVCLRGSIVLQVLEAPSSANDVVGTGEKNG